MLLHRVSRPGGVREVAGNVLGTGLDVVSLPAPVATGLVSVDLNAAELLVLTISKIDALVAQDEEVTDVTLLRLA